MLLQGSSKLWNMDSSHTCSTWQHRKIYTISTSIPLSIIIGICLRWHWARGGVQLGQTISSSQGWHVETSNDTHSHSHIYSKQNKVPNGSNLHVSGLWDEAGVPGGNTGRHSETCTQGLALCANHCSMSPWTFNLWTPKSSLFLASNCTFLSNMKKIYHGLPEMLH